MRSRAEMVLRWTAGLGAVLTLVALALATTGVTPAAWTMLGLIYVTAVSYGLAEMVRLYHRHKRRCQECMEGTGVHLRWWGLRLILVLVVSVLPVLLILPLFSNLR